ncbi:MAG: hypothetical protein O3C23_00705 [bacterium]|nr:hypothetical protein [bacterium]
MKHEACSRFPRHFQGLLWSKPIEKLDLTKDKVYIIHQILAFGSFEDIKVLFRLYSKKEIRTVFTHYPKQIYKAAMFSFVKNFILGLKDTILNSQRYVQASVGNN